MDKYQKNGSIQKSQEQENVDTATFNEALRILNQECQGIFDIQNEPKNKSSGSLIAEKEQTAADMNQNFDSRKHQLDNNQKTNNFQGLKLSSDQQQILDAQIDKFTKNKKMSQQDVKQIETRKDNSQINSQSIKQNLDTFQFLNDVKMDSKFSPNNLVKSEAKQIQIDKDVTNSNNAQSYNLKEQMQQQALKIDNFQQQFMNDNRDYLKYFENSDRLDNGGSEFNKINFIKQAEIYLKTRKYYSKNNQSAYKMNKVHHQFNLIERFLDVCKVIMNRIQVQSIIYRKEFLSQVNAFKHQLVFSLVPAFQIIEQLIQQQYSDQDNLATPIDQDQIKLFFDNLSLSQTEAIEDAVSLFESQIHQMFIDVYLAKLFGYQDVEQYIQQRHMKNNQNDDDQSNHKMDSQKKDDIQHAINFGSAELVLRRIYKSTQVQQLNFSFMNTIFQQDFIIPLSNFDEKFQETKYHGHTQGLFKNKFQSKISSSERAHRQKIMQEIIQINEMSKLQLKLIVQRFIPLFNILLDEVLDEVIFSWLQSKLLKQQNKDSHQSIHIENSLNQQMLKFVAFSKECFKELISEPDQEIIDQMIDQHHKLFTAQVNFPDKLSESQHITTNNEQIQQKYKENNAKNSESQSDSSSEGSIAEGFSQWVKQQAINYPNDSQNKTSAFESLSGSIAKQLFSIEELREMQIENILIIQLLEVGNTLDAAIISYKLLKSLNLEDDPDHNKVDNSQSTNQIQVSQQASIGANTNHNNNQNVQHCKNQNKKLFENNIGKFKNWRQRKCHCCMEPILEAGKAVICLNIIQQDEPCLNIYCQNCCVNFCLENYNFEHGAQAQKDQNLESSPEAKSKTLQTSQNEKNTIKKQSTKDKNQMILRHKLWLHIVQNVLFVCPCCQGYCLEQPNQSGKKTFANYSQCNIQYKIKNKPRSFINKVIYWYHGYKVNRQFNLAKINGMVIQRNYHKIELDINEKQHTVKLEKETFFFQQTVKPNTKLYKCIEAQGIELDIKRQFDMYQRDILNFEPIELLILLNKYQIMFKGTIYDEMVVPTFSLATSEDQGDEEDLMLFNSRSEYLQHYQSVFFKENIDLFVPLENGFVECLYHFDFFDSKPNSKDKLVVNRQYRDHQALEQVKGNAYDYHNNMTNARPSHFSNQINQISKQMPSLMQQVRNNMLQRDSKLSGINNMDYNFRGAPSDRFGNPIKAKNSVMFDHSLSLTSQGNQHLKSSGLLEGVRKNSHTSFDDKHTNQMLTCSDQFGFQNKLALQIGQQKSRSLQTYGNGVGEDNNLTKNMYQNELPPLMADPSTQTRNIYNDGSRLVQQKNLALASLLNKGAENYPLLITKEVFRIEKVLPEDRKMQAMNPFDWPPGLHCHRSNLNSFDHANQQSDGPTLNDYDAIVRNAGCLSKAPKHNQIQTRNNTQTPMQPTQSIFKSSKVAVEQSRINYSGKSNLGFIDSDDADKVVHKPVHKQSQSSMHPFEIQKVVKKEPYQSSSDCHRLQDKFAFAKSNQDSQMTERQFVQENQLKLQNDIDTTNSKHKDSLVVNKESQPADSKLILDKNDASIEQGRYPKVTQLDTQIITSTAKDKLDVPDSKREVSKKDSDLMEKENESDQTQRSKIAASNSKSKRIESNEEQKNYIKELIKVQHKLKNDKNFDLREFLQNEDKNYNLRKKNSDISLNETVLMKKHSNQNSQNYQQHIQKLLQEHDIEEGFFDDFPEDFCQQMGIKKSEKYMSKKLSNSNNQSPEKFQNQKNPVTPKEIQESPSKKVETKLQQTSLIVKETEKEMSQKKEPQPQDVLASNIAGMTSKLINDELSEDEIMQQTIENNCLSDNSDKKIDKQYDMSPKTPKINQEEATVQDEWHSGVKFKNKSQDFISSIFRQRYKLTSELAENVKFLRLLVQKYPEKLVNVYVYIFRPQFNLWRRALIKSYMSSSNMENTEKQAEFLIPNVQMKSECKEFVDAISQCEKPRYFQVQMIRSQCRNDSVRYVNLNETCFIIDHNCRDETQSNSSIIVQDQQVLNKSGNKVQSFGFESKEKSQQAQEVDKLLRQPRFNTNRTKKLLYKLIKEIEIQEQQQKAAQMVEPSEPPVPQVPKQIPSQISSPKQSKSIQIEKPAPCEDVSDPSAAAAKPQKRKYVKQADKAKLAALRNQEQATKKNQQVSDPPSGSKNEQINSQIKSLEQNQQNVTQEDAASNHRKNSCDKSSIAPKKRKISQGNQKEISNKAQKLSAEKKNKIQADNNEINQSTAQEAQLNLEQVQQQNQEIKLLNMQEKEQQNDVFVKQNYSSSVLWPEWAYGMNYRIIPCHIRSKDLSSNMLNINQQNQINSQPKKQLYAQQVFYKTIPQNSNEYLPIQIQNADGITEDLEPTMSADLYDQNQYAQVNNQSYLIQANQQYLNDILLQNQQNYQIHQLSDETLNQLIQQQQLKNSQNQGVFQIQVQNPGDLLNLDNQNVVEPGIVFQQARPEEAAGQQQNKLVGIDKSNVDINGNRFQTINVQAPDNSNRQVAVTVDNKQGLIIQQQQQSGSQPDQQHRKIKNMMQKIQMYENNTFEQIPEGEAANAPQIQQDVIYDLVERQGELVLEARPNNVFVKVDQNGRQILVSRSQVDQNQLQQSQIQQDGHETKQDSQIAGQAQVINQQAIDKEIQFINEPNIYESMAQLQVKIDQLQFEKQNGNAQTIQFQELPDDQQIMSQQPLREQLIAYKQLYQQKVSDLVASNQVLVTMPQTLFVPIEQKQNTEEVDGVQQTHQLNMQQLLGHLGQLTNSQSCYQLLEKLKEDGVLETAESVSDFLSQQYKKQIFQNLSVLQQIEKMIEQLDSQQQQSLASNLKQSNGGQINSLNGQTQVIGEKADQLQDQSYQVVADQQQLKQFELQNQTQVMGHQIQSKQIAQINGNVNGQNDVQTSSLLQETSLLKQPDQIIKKSYGNDQVNNNQILQMIDRLQNIDQSFKHDENQNQMVQNSNQVKDQQQNQITDQQIQSKMLEDFEKEVPEQQIGLEQNLNHQNKLMRIQQGAAVIRNQQKDIYKLLSKILQLFASNCAQGMQIENHGLQIQNMLQLNNQQNGSNVSYDQLGIEGNFQKQLLNQLISEHSKEKAMQQELSDKYSVSQQLVHGHLQEISEQERKMKYLIKLKKMIEQVDSVGRFLWFKDSERLDGCQDIEDKLEREMEHDDQVFEFFYPSDRHGNQPIIISAFETLEQGMSVLENGYKQTQQIENEIWSLMAVNEPKNQVLQNYLQNEEMDLFQQDFQVQTNDLLGNQKQQSVELPASQNTHQNQQIEQQSQNLKHIQDHFQNLITKQQELSQDRHYPKQQLHLPPTINPYQEIQNIKSQLKVQQQQKGNRTILQPEKQLKGNRNQQDSSLLYPTIEYIYTIKNPTVKKKRLKKYLENFYTNKILKCQYKKCNCITCDQMKYPMLIPFNVESSLFIEDHSQQYQKIWREREKKSGQHIYNFLFCQRKSRRQVDREQRTRFYFDTLNSFQRAMVSGRQEHYGSSLEERPDQGNQQQMNWCLDAELVTEQMSYQLKAGYKNELFEAVIQNSIKEFWEEPSIPSQNNKSNADTDKNEINLTKKHVKLPSLSQLCLVDDQNNFKQFMALDSVTRKDESNHKIKMKKQQRDSVENNLLNSIYFMKNLHKDKNQKQSDRIDGNEHKMSQNKKRDHKYHLKDFNKNWKDVINESDSALSECSSYNSSDLADDHHQISREINMLTQMERQITDMKINKTVQWAKRQRRFEIKKINKLNKESLAGQQNQLLNQQFGVKQFLSANNQQESNGLEDQINSNEQKIEKNQIDSVQHINKYENNASQYQQNEQMNQIQEENQQIPIPSSLLQGIDIPTEDQLRHAQIRIRHEMLMRQNQQAESQQMHSIQQTVQQHEANTSLLVPAAKDQNVQKQQHLQSQSKTTADAIGSAKNNNEVSKDKLTKQEHSKSNAPQNQKKKSSKPIQKPQQTEQAKPQQEHGAVGQNQKNGVSSKQNRSKKQSAQQQQVQTTSSEQKSTQQKSKNQKLQKQDQQQADDKKDIQSASKTTERKSNQKNANKNQYKFEKQNLLIKDIPIKTQKSTTSKVQSKDQRDQSKQQQKSQNVEIIKQQSKQQTETQKTSQLNQRQPDMVLSQTSQPTTTQVLSNMVVTNDALNKMMQDNLQKLNKGPQNDYKQMNQEQQLHLSNSSKINKKNIQEISAKRAKNSDQQQANNIQHQFGLTNFLNQQNDLEVQNQAEQLKQANLSQQNDQINQLRSYKATNIVQQTSQLGQRLHQGIGKRSNEIGLDEQELMIRAGQEALDLQESNWNQISKTDNSPMKLDMFQQIILQNQSQMDYNLPVHANTANQAAAMGGSSQQQYQLLSNQQSQQFGMSNQKLNEFMDGNQQAILSQLIGAQSINSQEKVQQQSQYQNSQQQAISRSRQQETNYQVASNEQQEESGLQLGFASFVQPISRSYSPSKNIQSDDNEAQDQIIQQQYASQSRQLSPEPKEQSPANAAAAADDEEDDDDEMAKLYRQLLSNQGNPNIGTHEKNDFAKQAEIEEGSKSNEVNVKQMTQQELEDQVKEDQLNYEQMMNSFREMNRQQQTSSKATVNQRSNQRSQPQTSARNTGHESGRTQKQTSKKQKKSKPRNQS